MSAIWTPRECSVATQMMAELMAVEVSKKQAFETIGLRLRRKWRSVQTRYFEHGKAFEGPLAYPKIRNVERGFVTAGRTDDRHVALEILKDRERRANLAPVSITAMLMGDPKPGQSALDQKNAARHVPTP